jgi:hypothetical protein
MFQLTPGKLAVCEHFNPHFYPVPEGGLSNTVFRATHYLDEIPNLKPD